MGNLVASFEQFNLNLKNGKMCGCCLCELVAGACCCACSLVRWIISIVISAVIIVAVVLCVVYLVDWGDDDSASVAQLPTTPLSRAGKSIILQAIAAGNQ